MLTAGRALALPFAGYLGIAAGSGLFGAMSMRNDNDKAYSSGLGLASGMLTYRAFSGRTAYVLKFLPPQGFVALALMYGLYS